MQLEIIFIVSALNRSGTNFLSDIVLLDKRFKTVPDVNEDYLLRYSGNIMSYVDQTVRHWSRGLREDFEVRRELMRVFGSSLESYLSKRAGYHDRLVLKTPRPEGLENAVLLFPNAKFLVIDRDGRDVVDSFVRSFDGHTFLQATRLWRDGVRSLDKAVLSLAQTGSSPPVMRLRYEDLVNGDSVTLRQLIAFCRLDREFVTPDAVRSLPLRGSSVVRGDIGGVHWHPISRPADYDPRAKWQRWPWYKSKLFYWVAGSELASLGYVD